MKKEESAMLNVQLIKIRITLQSFKKRQENISTMKEK